MLLFFPVVIWSQEKCIVFVEAGTSINQPFQNTVKSSGFVFPYYGWCGNGATKTPIGTYNSTTIYNTTFSFYSKIGFEYSFVKKKYFSLSFPFMLGYRERNENYKTDREEFYYSNSNTSFVSQTTQNFSRNFSFVIGPKASFQIKKFSVFTAVYFNMDVSYYSKQMINQQKIYEKKPDIEGLSMWEYVRFNLSIQNGIIYDLNAKWSLGLTLDMYLYNLDDAVRDDTKNNHLFNYGYSAYSTIINTGIRLQYKF